MLVGGVGNDTLVGALGKDLLQGGGGQDRFDFNLVTELPAGANCDVLQSGGGGNAFDVPGGGNGGDRIDVSDIDANGTAAGTRPSSSAAPAGATSGA